MSRGLLYFATCHPRLQACAPCSSERTPCRKRASNRRRRAEEYGKAQCRWRRCSEMEGGNPLLRLGLICASLSCRYTRLRNVFSVVLDKYKWTYHDDRRCRMSRPPSCEISRLIRRIACCRRRGQLHKGTSCLIKRCLHSSCTPSARRERNYPTGK